jgi:hypothetical protein
MTTSGTRSRFIAWVSLLATLFSAVSPAIAATLLTDQPAALAQLLGIPPVPQASPEDEHAAHGAHHHDGSDSKPGGGAPHTGHGIYCSFCLNASSTLALSAPLPLVVVATLASNDLADEPQHVFTTAFHPLYRSRAPPLLP